MGLVLQMQRRALESAIGGSYIPIANSRRYWIENHEIFFWGTSKGYGTCSDIHGLDIAVFGFKEKEVPIHGEQILRFAAVDIEVCGSERIVKCIMPERITEEEVHFNYTGSDIPYKKL